MTTGSLARLSVRTRWGVCQNHRMDGVHDLGGMHGFGAVPIEVDEPLFHEPWEGRVGRDARAT